MASVPKALLDKVNSWPSDTSRPSNNDWILDHQHRWHLYVGYTGSAVTLADFTKIVQASTAKPSRMKAQGTRITANTKSLLESSGRVHPPPRSFKVRGIENLGSSCYLASALHLIRACKLFRNALLQTPFSDQSVADPMEIEGEFSFKDDDGRVLNLAKELRTAILCIEDLKLQGSFQPSSLLQSLQVIKPDWDADQQQDAAEVWLIFKEALQKCINKAKGSMPTNQYPVGDRIATSSHGNWSSVLKYQSDSCGDRLFLGQYVMERTCTRCKTPKPATFGTFSFIELSMLLDLRKRAEGKVIPLRTLLRLKYEEAFVDMECDECNEMTSFTETQLLTRLSEYLIFTISHFENRPAGGKIKDSVSFEVDGMNMYDYVHPEMRSGHSPHYDCHAVIHHRGDTIIAGHYITYVREEWMDKQWTLYIDEESSLVQPPEIMGPGCYAVKYQRRQEQSRSPSCRFTSPMTTPPPPSPAPKAGKPAIDLDQKRLDLDNVRKEYQDKKPNPKIPGAGVRALEPEVIRADQSYEKARSQK